MAISRQLAVMVLWVKFKWVSASGQSGRCVNDFVLERKRNVEMNSNNLLLGTNLVYCARCFLGWRELQRSQCWLSFLGGHLRLLPTKFQTSIRHLPFRVTHTSCQESEMPISPVPITIVLLRRITIYMRAVPRQTFS